MVIAETMARKHTYCLVHVVGDYNYDEINWDFRVSAKSEEGNSGEFRL